MDPKFFLVMRRVRELAQPESSDADFVELLGALSELEGEEPDLRAALIARDREALTSMVEDWKTSRRKVPVQDQAVFKRALKAFRKRLKLMRLDDESKLGQNAMTTGRASSILGVRAPDSYPDEVWDELAFHGRLVDAGDGLYELPST